MNKVLGICGCGSNILKNIWKQKLMNLELIVFQTDPYFFARDRAHQKILIDSDLDKNLDKVLFNSSKVFILFGLSGTSGSHFGEFILKTVIEKGLEVKVICIYPFDWEGKQRKEKADMMLKRLQNLTSNIAVMKNDVIHDLMTHDVSADKAYNLFDQKIYDIICFDSS
jgi:cell division protein FtsZ